MMVRAIKILMPQKLRTLESGLRLVGYGPQVDEFILSMNRAAQQAAPDAQRIFWDAITKMSFADARNILNGGDTAATEYFKDKTTERLTAAFRPVVDKAMNEVGVTRQYKELIGRYQAIPFVKRHRPVCGHERPRWAVLCRGAGGAQDPHGPDGTSNRPAEGGVREMSERVGAH